MSEAHARLGPSNARWPNCPGSVREEEQYPDIAGEAAIDGTGSHLLLELSLQNGVSAAQYDQQIIGVNHPDQPAGWLVSIDRINRVQMCLDYVTRRVTELKEQFPGCSVTVEAESKANPGEAFGRTDWWGTVDITITARHGMTGEAYFIEVVDYKDGRGYVSEKNNTQLISYLFGKMKPYIYNQNADKFNPLNVGGCRMTIVQPKTNPVVRYQCSTDGGTSPKEVLEKAKELSVAAAATDNPDAPLIPGKHCQWCKANPKRGGHCAAETNKSMEVVETMNELVEAPVNGDLFAYVQQAVSDPKSLTVEQLSQLASAEEGLQAMFEKVKTEITERIEQGISVPGYAMRPGRGSRVWNEDEEVIAKKLKSRRLKQDDIYPKKLISPAQVMKLESLTDQQKARIEKDLISFSAGKLKLTKVAHDAPAEKVVAQSSTSDVQSAEMMFGDVVNAEQKSEEPVSFF